MTIAHAERTLIEALDRWQARGQVARFWLRDDDAVEPTGALDAFLSLTGAASLPVTLAVIPKHTGPALRDRLAREPLVSVALHGWSHVNHAPATEKKQELGSHRPAGEVLAELRTGFSKLEELYGQKLLPMLVPPWNRIAAPLLPQLGGLGLKVLSVFGPEKPGPIRMLNTHVDVMDWHGTRGGRDIPALFAETAARLDQMGEDQSVGVLTHHLVHDAAVADFLQALIALTREHPGCQWVPAGALLGEAGD